MRVIVSKGIEKLGEEKTTGNSSISWDKLYYLIAVEADDYSNTLERQLM